MKSSNVNNKQINSDTIRKSPFKIKNEYYNYEVLTENSTLAKGVYYVLLIYKGSVSISNLDKIKELRELEYLEIVPEQDLLIALQNGSHAILLSKHLLSDKYIAPVTGSVMSTYKVTKPWGYEYWITGLNPKNGCVLKYIYINQGTKTSLQVHLHKFESNYLVEGQAKYTSSKTEYTNKNYPYEYYSRNIDCGVVIDVTPNKIHQLYASSDITLIEASTNHLDDVIRLQDDSGRSDGKIMSEHLE